MRWRGILDEDHEDSAFAREPGMPAGFYDGPAVLLGVRSRVRPGLLAIHGRVRNRSRHPDLQAAQAAFWERVGSLGPDEGSYGLPVSVSLSAEGARPTAVALAPLRDLRFWGGLTGTPLGAGRTWRGSACRMVNAWDVRCCSASGPTASSAPFGRT